GAARSALPESVDPGLGPIATGLGEIFMFTVDSEPGAKNADGTDVTPTDLRSVHDWIIRPQLLRVPGVVEVNPIGGFKKEILVAPDPVKLLAFGVTAADIVEALQTNNQNRGAGYIEHNGAQWLMRISGQAENLEHLKAAVVVEREGLPVHVSDVADV